MNMMTILWIVTPLFGITLFVLMMILAIGGKNLRTVFIANLRKSPTLLMYTKGKQALLVTGKKKGGTLDTEFGPIFLNPDALTNFGSTTIGLAYEEIANTIPIGFIKAASELKEEGIKDYDEAISLEEMLAKNKFEEEQKPDPDDKKVRQLNKTLKNIYYIKDYFKYFLNPSHVNEKISNELQERLGERKTDMMKWGIVMIGIIMAGAIAYVIISKMSGAACNYEPYRAALEMCRQQSSNVVQANQTII